MTAHVLNLSDTMAIADSIAKAVGKPRSDSVAVADALSKATGKSLLDSVAAVDSVVKFSGKAMSDSVAIADSLSKATSMSLSDHFRIRELLCIPITIDHTKVAGDCTDFPVGINERDLPDAFWQCVSEGGINVLVKDAFGTTLKREVVSIDTVAETFEMWFKVPSLSASVDTVIYVFLTTASYTNDLDTWRTEYVGVYHCNDAPGDATMILDSTVNANHGTKGAGAAAPTEVAGVVGKAQQFVAASHQYINLTSAVLGPFSALTITLVGKQSAATGTVRYPVDFGFWEAGYGAVINVHQTTNTQYWRLRNTAAAIGDLPSTAFTPDAPFSLAVSWNGASAQQYMNGSAAGAPVAFNGTMTPKLQALGYHRVGGGSLYHNGVEDELRLSSVAWGPEWNATEDASLRGIATFYSVGAPSFMAMAFGKALSDTHAIADSISKGTAKPLTDSVAITDAVVKAMGLAEADTLVIADAIVKDIGLYKADTMTIADVIAKAIGMPLADTLVITDSLSKAVGIILTETMAIADSVVKAVGLGKAETMTITDALAKHMTKALADSMAIVDSMVMTGTYARPGIQVAAFLFSRAINALLYSRDIVAKHRREF
jgi:hypothetical protein